jgi:hypothetical protein
MSLLGYSRKTRSRTLIYTKKYLSRRVEAGISLIVRKALRGNEIIWFHHDSAHAYKNKHSLLVDAVFVA